MNHSNQANTVNANIVATFNQQHANVSVLLCYYYFEYFIANIRAIMQASFQSMATKQTKKKKLSGACAHAHEKWAEFSSRSGRGERRTQKHQAVIIFF